MMCYSRFIFLSSAWVGLSISKTLGSWRRYPSIILIAFTAYSGFYFKLMIEIVDARKASTIYGEEPIGRRSLDSVMLKKTFRSLSVYVFYPRR